MFPNEKSGQNLQMVFLGVGVGWEMGGEEWECVVNFQFFKLINFYSFACICVEANISLKFP